MLSTILRSSTSSLNSLGWLASRASRPPDTVTVFHSSSFSTLPAFAKTSVREPSFSPFTKANGISDAHEVRPLTRRLSCGFQAPSPSLLKLGQGGNRMWQFVSIRSPTASRPSQACVQRFNTTARAALGVAALPWATSPKDHGDHRSGLVAGRSIKNALPLATFQFAPYAALFFSFPLVGPRNGLAVLFRFPGGPIGIIPRPHRCGTSHICCRSFPHLCRLQTCKRRQPDPDYRKHL